MEIPIVIENEFIFALLLWHIKLVMTLQFQSLMTKSEALFLKKNHYLNAH